MEVDEGVPDLMEYMAKAAVPDGFRPVADAGGKGSVVITLTSALRPLKLHPHSGQSRQWWTSDQRQSTTPSCSRLCVIARNCRFKQRPRDRMEIPAAGGKE